MSILKGETSDDEAARTYRLAGEVSTRAENALRSRPRDQEAVKDEQIKKLKQRIGDLALDNNILWEALKPCLFDRKTCDGRMARCRLSQNGGAVRCSG